MFLPKNLRLNLFSNINLKNEPNTSEILQTFDRFFFALGRFLAVNELTVIPTGDVPSFVQSSGFILPSELYKRYILGDTRYLVCVHFLATLNVHLGGNKMISETERVSFFTIYLCKL